MNRKQLHGKVISLNASSFVFDIYNGISIEKTMCDFEKSVQECLASDCAVEIDMNINSQITQGGVLLRHEIALDNFFRHLPVKYGNVKLIYR